ncbi:hypothetical protein [Edaphobacter flagellatus]|uniref:hypothetical protein n=1 Tax=Edaphobacter flagellatus TaxID=1933044 RepID=UPI0021B4BD36|nr:hypothetical protein [Edaphobacter flagellatus]
MATYHQMGNDSANLTFDLNLATYKGSILSPVNQTSDEMLKYVEKTREKQRTSFEVIFDPQLYSPRSERGCLPSWPYFPKDVDTADLSALDWWKQTADLVLSTALKMAPNAICSPAMVPRTFSDAYYEQVVLTSDHLTQCLTGSTHRSIMTAIVDLEQTGTPNYSNTVTSILSRAKTNEVYLVFYSTTEPRREQKDTEALKGAMKVIEKLESAGMRVLVGFCSTDVLLWKAAGATACATGKFFNIRRFTLGRFDEPKDGGGQIPYWIEEALLALVRQSDLIRLQQRGMLSEASRRNPFGADIINAFTNNKPWLALSWKQYLWWFADVEQRLTLKSVTAQDLINTADSNWASLEETPRMIFEERKNDGSWTREWLRAIEELSSFV